MRIRSIIAPLIVLGGLAASHVAVAQSSGSGDSTAAQPVPNPAQQRYLQGLRTAGRGVAQIKTGIDRLTRARGSGDTSQVKLATKRLTGYCTAARGFIASGRGQMDPVAYELPIRKPAKDLLTQIDSLSLSVKDCQSGKGLAPQSLGIGLVLRLRAYDAALADFRTAIGLPNR